MDVCPVMFGGHCEFQNGLICTACDPDTERFMDEYFREEARKKRAQEKKDGGEKLY